MAIGESLKVIIGADADPLIKELKKAERDIRTFGRSVEGSLRAISGSMSTLLGVGIGGGIAVMVKQTLESISTLGDHADALGINVEKLQAWQFAAGQAGVSAQQFDNGLTKLSQKLGEARAGNEEAIKTFQKWGVEFKSGDLGDMVGRFADRMRSIEDPALRAAAAADMFGGKIGQSFVNLLSQGGAGLAEMEARARDMGAVLDAELVRKGKQAGDQLKALGDVAGTQLSVAIVELLPSLQVMADILGVIARVAKTVGDGFREIAAATAYFSHGGTLNPATMLLQGAELSAQPDLLPAKKQLEKSSSNDGWKPTASTKEASHALADYIAKLKEENTELGLSGVAREEQKALFAAEAAALRDKTSLTAAQTAEIKGLVAANFELTEAEKKAKEEAQELKQFGNQLAATMSSAFEDAIFEGKSLGDTFKALEMDIAKVIFRFLVLKPLVDSLGDALGGGSGGGGFSLGGIGDMFSGLFGGGGMFSPGTVNAGSLMSAGGVSFAGFAEGGMPPIGLPSIVGEKGPELFVPRVRGNIVPNNKLGGQTVVFNQHLNFSMGVPETVRREMLAFMPQIVEVTKNAVADGSRRGGTFARAIGTA